MEGGTRLTGLWKSKDKKGKTYLSGSLSGITRLMVFPNDHKRTEKDPDYFAYIVQREKKAATTEPTPAEDDL